MTRWRVVVGDVRERLRDLPDGCVQTVVTSPPYWGLRDYGTGVWVGGDPACAHKQGRDGAGRADGRVDDSGQRNRDGVAALVRSVCRCGAVRQDAQIGLEPTPEAYVRSMVEVFSEVRRVLKDDGTLWLNLGDSYASGGTGGYGPASTLSGYTSENTKHRRAYESAITRKRPHGLKDKDLAGIPWMVAFALRAEGWYLRSDIIWSKPNPMPESVTDRPTKAHEYIFLLSKSARYYYDAAAIAEPVTPSRVGRVRADVIGGASFVERGQHSKGGTYKSGNKRRDIPMLDDGRGITNDHIGRGVPWEDDGSGRNKRSVWHVATQPFSGAELLADYEGDDGRLYKLSADCPVHALHRASRTTRKAECDARRDRHSEGTAQCNCTPVTVDHFATYPEKLIEPCILDGSRVGDLVLDPFTGSGTTGSVSVRLQRSFVGVELNPQYVELARRRIGAVAPLFAEEATPEEVK